jgi:lipopolysaccharide export system permease protein
MYILTRYVVWEVLKMFLAALFGLTLMVTLGMGFNEGLKKGLPALVMLRTMPYMLPEMLGITIPVAMLYAVSNVFGRMTGTNEVVAVKSLGINPMALVWPVIALATFCSLATVMMYEVAATWCRPSVSRIVCESIEDIVYGVLQKAPSMGGDNFPFSITRKELHGRKLINPIITLKGQSGRPQTTVTADEAELSTDRRNPAALVLNLDYTNSQVDIDGVGRFWNAGTERYAVPIDIPPPDHHHRDWVAMRDIPNSIAELQKEIVNLKKQQETLIEVRKCYQKANKILGIVESRDNVEEINDQIAKRQERIYRLRTEPYRRWANGFTCLCFALIGIPVAMLWRHADGLTNFFVCFLPILAVYYPLLMLSDNLTTSGTLWPICFWMSNVVLTLPAICLLRWINKH